MVKMRSITHFSIILLIVICAIISLWILEGRKEEKRSFIEVLTDENITIGKGAHLNIVLDVRSSDPAYNSFVDIWIISKNSSLYFVDAYPTEHIERFNEQFVHFYISRFTPNKTLAVTPIASLEGDYIVYINHTWSGQRKYSSRNITVVCSW
jgi:hypothetical protein